MSLVVDRRAILGALTVAGYPRPGIAQSRVDHGRVEPPLDVPDLTLHCHDGRHASLATLVMGRATALQLMFTACNTACPIEGATFSRVQKLIPDAAQRGIQLLSLSVDPERDDPVSLRAWLDRFHGAPGWIAAAPRLEDVARLRAFAGSGRNPADNHSTQVQLIDRKARLIFRTYELPEAEEIAAILRKM